MIPHHWKRAPADNGAADPNGDVRPDRPANSILGAIRGLMATGAAARDDATGELVATIGTSRTNAYSVSSNEGLIDMTTGINGVPAAIMAPFLLRLSFDTTLAGSGWNTPHLVVDGFDCGPIVRRDGSALADGDLVRGRVVLLLGDMAAATDTKVTRVRVLDETPGELAAAVNAITATAATAAAVANALAAAQDAQYYSVRSLRFVYAGTIGNDVGSNNNPNFISPFGGYACVVDRWTAPAPGQTGGNAIVNLLFRYLQMYTPAQGWVTVGAAS